MNFWERGFEMMNAKEKEYMDYLIHNRNQLTEQNTRILEEVLRLQKKLDIAVKALEELKPRLESEDDWLIAARALREIDLVEE
jgi:hypothetical protein